MLLSNDFIFPENHKICSVDAKFTALKSCIQFTVYLRYVKKLVKWDAVLFLQKDSSRQYWHGERCILHLFTCVFRQQTCRGYTDQGQICGSELAEAISRNV